jgi:hypothetical protein
MLFAIPPLPPLLAPGDFVGIDRKVQVGSLATHLQDLGRISQ